MHSSMTRHAEETADKRTLHDVIKRLDVDTASTDRHAAPGRASADAQTSWVRYGTNASLAQMARRPACLARDRPRFVRPGAH